MAALPAKAQEGHALPLHHSDLRLGRYLLAEKVSLCAPAVHAVKSVPVVCFVVFSQAVHPLLYFC